MNYYKNIDATVEAAIAEDVGTGDLTAYLINKDSISSAQVITREEAVICGRPWVDKVFELIDIDIRIDWLIDEGQVVNAGDIIFEIEGCTQKLLTAERTALNFLQTLSATATKTNKFCNLIAHTNAKLLDTRKTIPGLRLAQKYAVKKGGGYNHRAGLYDAFLIKENHITASGSIAEAARLARKTSPNSRLEIEVEDLDQLSLAMKCNPDWVMLDNFSIEDIRIAVKHTNKAIKLEASGGIETNEHLIRIAETEVDYISMGALTKHCQAVDFSMLFN
ncbi:MAG: nicotinate-nucleotide diphosphorylase (carboxylating) [Gammaproteobacteria bacterium]|uniref:Probable nicotinate-nucleotide pyrophosphorylase [carboxylating] n=1 Tax=OM182 bacterium TaxID=2510334 RepID=A0A520S4X7_9GAMM|nr:nicotinate-nucleotide diphosphorylase (carboxylating) [Gammaproteobacteria bacterium]OUV67521.1 MAG: nicotinate-nucleotide diphosphorylase (carboxylating) [Gammaproteobacteria bacterium TMED133]RZO77494.1 MAG: carboxylating nicotinate-nucleotide diphosphorylase [OM182 bacterium]